MKKILVICMLSGIAVAGELKSCMQYLESDQFTNAAECFEEAANSGNQMAQYNLAVMYNNGFGVKKDKDLSTKLIQKAISGDS